MYLRVLHYWYVAAVILMILLLLFVTHVALYFMAILLWDKFYFLLSKVMTSFMCFLIRFVVFYTILHCVTITGVLVGGGGGLGGRLPPKWNSIMTYYKFNHDLFSMYQQNIERNSSLRMWKSQNFLSSLAPLARIHIHLLNVSVCRYTVVYI